MLHERERLIRRTVGVRHCLIDMERIDPSRGTVERDFLSAQLSDEVRELTCHVQDADVIPFDRLIEDRLLEQR